MPFSEDSEDLLLVKQGSDLIELRLTWREMKNLIFERFIRFFGHILEDFWTIFEEFCRNWFIVGRRRLKKISKNFHQSETNKEV